MIVLHHDMSFQIGMSLFLFKIQNGVLQMWATIFKDGAIEHASL